MKRSTRLILTGSAIVFVCIVLALVAGFVFREQILTWALARFGPKDPALMPVAQAIQSGMPGFSRDPSDSTHLIIGGMQGLASFSDSVASGETKKYEIYVDPNKYISFTCFSKGGVQLVAIDPKGARFDSLAAERNKNSSYISIDMMEGEAVTNINFVNPQTGNWIVEVSPGTRSGKKISYELTARFDGSDINLLVETNKDHYFRKDTILVTGILTKGIMPVLGANVQAYASIGPGSIDSLILYDDGTHGDGIPNDGRYSNVYTNTAQKGQLTISLKARGQGPKPFWRITKTFVNITSQANFNGQFRDYGRDTNGDTLFEELIVEAGINVVDPDTYKFVAELRVPDGPNGKPAPGEEYIASMLGSSGADTFLTAGEHLIPIVFDGETLYEKRHDGPYQFEQLAVFIEDTFGSATVDLFDGIYLTQKYSYWDFQGRGIQDLSSFSDRGIDIDGDGLFDSLEVTLEMDLRESDYYHWQGVLIYSTEPNGSDYALGEGRLEAGKQRISVRFDGHAIGRSGNDGPYVVNAGTMYGTKGTNFLGTMYHTKAYRASQFEK